MNLVEKNHRPSMQFCHHFPPGERQKQGDICLLVEVVSIIEPLLKSILQTVKDTVHREFSSLWTGEKS